MVDDDLAVRESLKFALELEGLVVHACGSGMELLRHPDLSRARCLVLDYRMPVIDGFEVIEHLSALQVALPVILITSAATDALRERASKAGVRYVRGKAAFRQRPAGEYPRRFEASASGGLRPRPAIYVEVRRR